MPLVLAIVAIILLIVAAVLYPGSPTRAVQCAYIAAAAVVALIAWPQLSGLGD